jgi:hypothetical protein
MYWVIAIIRNFVFCLDSRSASEIFRVFLLFISHRLVLYDVLRQILLSPPLSPAYVLSWCYWNDLRQLSFWSFSLVTYFL